LNCNPETVSTDYDVSTRLYFEPLTLEDVLEVIAAEERTGGVIGVFVQLGGQTPLKLARAIESAGYTILGTQYDAVDLAEDRERFAGLLRAHDLRSPAWGMAGSSEDAVRVANDIGYPVLIRPSYVLGGRAMEIVRDPRDLERYMTWALGANPRGEVLVDKYLKGVEVEVDAISDGATVVIPGVMQHVERAGVHSGDSYAVYPGTRYRARRAGGSHRLHDPVSRVTSASGGCSTSSSSSTGAGSTCWR